MNIKLLISTCLLCVTASTTVLAQSARVTDQKLLDSGKALFQQNCAGCHGLNAEGIVSNWRQVGADGKFPPPPLNGDGHTWHHTIRGLAQTIKNGTLSIGGSMPPWKDKLSEEEILTIIIWVSSLWPDELYNSWMERNASQ